MFTSHRPSSVQVGIEFGADAARIALVRSGDGAVIGLGTAPYPSGTVVDGVLRRVGPAVEAVGQLLGQVRWPGKPQCAIVVSAIDGDATITAPIIDGGPVGSASASAWQVDSAVDVAAQAVGDVELVDCVPVAVLRFARLCRPGPGALFAQGVSGRRSWTAYADQQAFDLDIDPATGQHGQSPAYLGDDRYVVGADLSTLAPMPWGDVAVARKVAKAFPAPGPFVPAVAAASALTGHGPTINLIGPGAGRSQSTPLHNNWGVEAIR